MRFGREHGGGNGASRRGLADFVNADFVVPQNPVIPGLTGLGDFSSDLSQFSSDIASGNFVQALSDDTFFGLPTWVYITSGVFLTMFVFGGHESRYVRTKKAVKKAVSSATSTYSGGSSGGGGGSNTAEIAAIIAAGGFLFYLYTQNQSGVAL